ncbi:alpha/beta-Hydrolases superfamily protein [Actinidia rufa]|uniref:Alpha/beta-Hydrolases superfamily protein n=1 Tax=Actinidia rufa TaxID=165716 RepID=A0A7J0FZS5_9ERIC|nr:alpha/beta-Hydrolases superfamily protein [Actinidia rufa]
MADVGFHCFAPDWIGFGFSDKPQPGYGFDYTGISCRFLWINSGPEKPSKISKLTILNSSLTVSSPIPGLFQQLRIPLFGEFTCQNAVMAERFIEAALLEAVKKANFKGISSQIAASFASGSWDKPILVVWGISDTYLPQSVAEEFQKGNPSNVKLKLIEGTGHMPQEDWPEKVVDALRLFF